MTDELKHEQAGSAEPPPAGGKVWAGPRARWVPVLVLVFVAISAAALTWFLTTIFEHKQEAKEPFSHVVNVTDTTYDPAVWGQNFPRHYQAHIATREMEEDNVVDREPTDDDPRTKIALSKLEKDPRLVTMWQGYAFSKDYRRPRGHEYMLEDQKLTKRVKVVKQPGACLNCHASLPEVMDTLGDGDRAKGWAEMNKLPFEEAVQHAKGPIACIDCHTPGTMELRITRPAFIEGIARYKEKVEGIQGYDVNRDATVQEMRAFVCAQCHVEYYFKGEGKTLTFPWSYGFQAMDAIKFYDEIGWNDFEHTLTGANVLKAQHPDFETWMQGTHAANGVTCADCHMPYRRDGAAKVMDHQIASPMRNDDMINATCLTCHHSTPQEMKERVDTIQHRWQDAVNVSFDALDALIKDIEANKETAKPEDLAKARDFQRWAQFLIDMNVSENSHGFHAPQYQVATLNQATDFARKGQLALHGIDVGPVTGSGQN
ncbi:ammonia-forming cytochrome c nitrite reductase subunit c552 [Tessaracoccus sp. OH4464_COT-324]|uniref:ammonia-forming cytochrome c nitrite reductase subunit c552 n=1 Tax=Tessaracoccus sp. OH4464_COT-324 TaxID=2491059 RepID=UPI000F63EF51|nr:ammonia-forming cytochrome c nitrite reductase subunit c552 [Tessaracoccus sp. OH4464_COT-324]RRD47204.1 ammonia-forming cytochrome c nitrite reductase subunit c552 [Tessaracoccus sp. OH4464_COT-324]